ncbi:hypothetical protein RB195_012298 [Necator americanus]|uniref:Uncharacterized protein n=1 Tax=Necator americanus TaxID=51031 RepID=A0ABR1D6G1_NECAM
MFYTIQVILDPDSTASFHMLVVTVIEVLEIFAIPADQVSSISIIIHLSFALSWDLSNMLEKKDGLIA